MIKFYDVVGSATCYRMAFSLGCSFAGPSIGWWLRGHSSAPACGSCEPKTSVHSRFFSRKAWLKKKNMSERLHASRNAIFISSSALQRTNIDKEKLAFVDPFPNGQSMGFWYIHHFTPDFHGTCLVWGPLATSCCRHSGQQPFWESVGWAPIGTASGFITSITGIHQRKILYPLVMKSG